MLDEIPVRHFVEHLVCVIRKYFRNWPGEEGRWREVMGSDDGHVIVGAMQEVAKEQDHKFASRPTFLREFLYQEKEGIWEKEEVMESEGGELLYQERENLIGEGEEVMESEGGEFLFQEKRGDLGRETEVVERRWEEMSLMKELVERWRWEERSFMKELERVRLGEKERKVRRMMKWEDRVGREGGEDVEKIFF